MRAEHVPLADRMMLDGSGELTRIRDCSCEGCENARARFQRDNQRANREGET